MAMSASHVELAQSLPPRLLRFFQRYPPAVYKGWQVAPGPGPNKNAVPVSEALIRANPQPDSDALDISEATSTPSTITEDKPDDRPPFNPFLPAKNFVTGKWRSPVFSLRRQAEICKLARSHGVEELLPYTTKLSWVKEQKRLEQGNRVKGTGVDEKVKGHKWERTMKSRLEKRRIAMEGMPKLIREWKERGHGRGWKKWPSGKATK